MTNLLKYTLFSIALALCSITMPAAVLPTLPVDARIKKGTLGCGATYYMVPNSKEKGYAEIAVIRRDESASDISRESLKADFFSRMSIAPGPEGYMTDNDGSTIFRYRRVPLYNQHILDSTLLYTFAQMAASRAEQAIIVAGDIDPVEFKKKMDIFSLIVPRILVQEAHEPDYVWEPSPAPYVIVNTVPGKKDVEISVTYASARIPQALMNTPQTLVTNILSREYQTILGHRLERNLREAGIPFGEIRFGAVKSSDTGGDERYSVTVRTSARYSDAAMRTMSSTIGELDAFGASVKEFSDANRTIQPWYLRKSAERPSPEEDVDMCIANFLFGAPLSPISEEAALFSRKNVPDSIRAGHFNLFSAALAEQLTNLSLVYTAGADSLDKDEALFYYNLAYLYGSIASSGKDYSWNSADTLGLETSAPKIRIKSEKAEPVTGGKLWTFSNGMRVAFKRLPGSGMFSYSMVLSGGLSSIPDIVPGEGGYISDMIGLFDAGGLTASGFRDVLSASGISMKADVGVFSMSLSGDAPASQLSLLLKALGALSSDRNLNRGEFDAYMRNQALVPVSVEDNALLQLNSGFTAAASKRKGALTQDTARKADKYFEGRLSRMNDGILLIAGDLDELLVKKLLLKHLGAFAAERGSIARPAVDLRPIVGTRTVQGDGAPGIYVLMDTDYAVTSQSYYTAYIAAEALRHSLVRHLIYYGYTADVQASITVQPHERVRMFISCKPASPSGLPANTVQDKERALSAVRAAIRDAYLKRVDANDLKAWKALCLSSVKASFTTAPGVIDALEARYAFGKDISRYEESFAAITVDSLMNMLQALATGGRIEYIADE